MRREERLTARLIRAAKPKASDYTIHDLKVPGLGVRVQPSGAKSYVLRSGSNRQTLGPVSSMTLSEARQEAVVIRRRLERDGKPIARSGAMGFAKLAALFLEAKSETYRAGSMEAAEIYLRTQLVPALGKVPIDQIRPAQVADWFHAYSERAPGGANEALNLLRTVLSWARERDLLPQEGPDPTAPIRKNRRSPRGCLLSADQLRRLGRVLSSPPDGTHQAALAIQLVLLTGCRPYEIARLDWSEVGKQTLRLGRTKTGPREVILSPEAKKLLRALRGVHASGPVFPGLDPETMRQRFTRDWHRIRAAAEIPEDVRLHDLRHTFASQAIMNGETLAATGELLGHRDPESVSVYSHLDGPHLIEAAEVVAALIADRLGMS